MWNMNHSIAEQNKLNVTRKSIDRFCRFTLHIIGKR